MPIYSYRCQECGNEQDGWSKDPVPVCCEHEMKKVPAMFRMAGDFRQKAATIKVNDWAPDGSLRGTSEYKHRENVPWR